MHSHTALVAIAIWVANGKGDQGSYVTQETEGGEDDDDGAGGGSAERTVEKMLAETPLLTRDA